MNRAKDDITTEYDYDGWGNLIRETINDGTTIKPPLGLPEDLAVGAGGELYLSDLLNPCILQLDWTTGDLAFSNFVVPSDDG